MKSLLQSIKNHQNQPLQKFKNMTNYTNGLPKGAIIMWHGSIYNIPDGWLICDGQKGTPDLRDRFIVGAGKDYKLNDTGGEKEVKLTLEQLPSHNHKISEAGEHTHEVRTGVSDMGNSYDYDDDGRHPAHWDGGTKVTSSANGKHTHTIDNVGNDKPHENRPPYYALFFIKRVI